MPLSSPLLHPLRLTLAAAVSLALVGACTGNSSATPATRPAASSTASTAASSAAPSGGPSAAAVSTDDAVDYVVAISVDGLNPHAIRQLGRSGAPNFYRMIDNGASTQNARTAYEQTITIPNHTGMLTGRRIGGAGGHHVTFDEDNGRTVAASAGGYVKSIFDDVHNHGGSTAFYSAKTKLDFLNRSWDSRHGSRDVVGADNGRDKIDRYSVDTESDNVTRLVRRLHTAPDELSFVHLAYPDRAGHKNGFMSGAYVRAVAQADHQIGRILAAVRNDTRLLRHANVMLTADHGGLGGSVSHSAHARPANYTIPFMIWGRGVARGADLYDLNTGTRARPASSRPTYAGRQPIRNMEVANLTADLLDLPTVPGSIADRAQDLAVR